MSFVFLSYFFVCVSFVFFSSSFLTASSTCVSFVDLPFLCTVVHVLVKSKETVGNSWTVLKVILGHKYHHNH